MVMMSGCGSSSETPSASASAVSESASAESSPSAAASEDGYVTITDHADRTVTVKADPESVVITGILPLASVLTVYLDSPETIKAMEPASMNAARNGILSEIYPDIVNIDTDIMNGDDLNV